MKMKRKKIAWVWLPVALVALLGFNGLSFGDASLTAYGDAEHNPYIPPAWSQILKASKRFVLVMKNEAVLDKETGLVWEKSPDTTTRVWANAISYAYSKNVGGRGGWRLPTVEELRSLIDPTQSNPALPSGHPFTNVQSDYWSSTNYVHDASLAWVVRFGDGFVYGAGKSNVGGNYAWCVRGGHGYDAP